MVTIGTRPEAIKLSPVIRALRPLAAVTVVRTGQQTVMVDAILDELEIFPDICIPQVPNPYSLTDLTAATLQSMQTVLKDISPEWVVVQGDTNSAAAAALAAFYQSIRIAHVEAGLRTHDFADPFPEEGNRRLIGSIATLHFAPTPRAEHNLRAEGIAAERIRVTGNTVVDALEDLRRRWNGPEQSQIIERLGIAGRKVVLVTCHRRENQGLALAGICDAIKTLAERYPEILWLFPMHPNPAMREVLRREIGSLPNVLLREPLNYREVLLVVEFSVLVMTDSGGLQEEVASFGRPVVVLRDCTERPEIVEAGLATLAGHGRDAIVAAVAARLDSVLAGANHARGPSPFGDGHAAERIASALIEFSR